MSAAVVFEGQVEIPLNVQTLVDFRRWALSENFPETGRIDFVGGSIEVDMSPEDIFFHGTVKTEIVTVFGQLVKARKLGFLFSDRTRISSISGDVSAEPDVVFVSEEALDEGRVRMIPGTSPGEDHYMELEGAPDLIVEIVSRSSVKKDTQRLPQAYFKAGVREFWLVDARGKSLLFHIHRPGLAGFEAVAAAAEGFQRSEVFQRQFRLDRERDAKGRWRYDLRVKE